jgi:hypothetical protein
VNLIWLLGQHIFRKFLFKQAFKRVQTIKNAFRGLSLSGEVSPKQMKKLEKKYRALGVFDFKEQDTQVRSPLERPFLVPIAYSVLDLGREFAPCSKSTHMAEAQGIASF